MRIASVADDFPELQRVLATAEKQIRAGKGIKHEEFWQEFAVEA